jgi:hypothetical protein
MVLTMTGLAFGCLWLVRQLGVSRAREESRKRRSSPGQALFSSRRR